MKKQEDKKWQGALTLSVTLHLILVGVFLFGMPSVFETLPEEQDALTFEILPLSAITNVKTENKSVQKEKEAKKSREVKKSQPKPAPKPPEPQKKKIEKQAPEQAKKKEITPVVKEKKPVEKPKPIPKKDEDAIDSIQKNLENDSQGDDAKISTRSHTAQKAGDKNSRGMDYDEDSPLSITEELYIKNQIQKHWRKPAGLPDINKIKITLSIWLEKDGSLKKVTRKNIICLTDQAICNLLEESALRGVKAASPFSDLLPERYDIWKKIHLEFDPATMAQ